MSEIKNGGLDQNGSKPFEQQQFGTGGFEGVNGGSFENVDNSLQSLASSSVQASCSRTIKLCSEVLMLA